MVPQTRKFENDSQEMTTLKNQESRCVRHSSSSEAVRSMKWTQGAGCSALELPLMCGKRVSKKNWFYWNHTNSA